MEIDRQNTQTHPYPNQAADGPCHRLTTTRLLLLAFAVQTQLEDFVVFAMSGERWREDCLGKHTVSRRTLSVTRIET